MKTLEQKLAELTPDRREAIAKRAAELVRLQVKAQELAQDLQNMEWEDRRGFMETVSMNFCKHCWGADPYCQCWNDE